MDKYLIIIISYDDFELINGFISLTRGMIAVFQNFPAVKKGVAQKAKFSISGGASSFRGDSRDILECPGSGIRFITIAQIFGQKSTSYDWAIYYAEESLPLQFVTLYKTHMQFDCQLSSQSYSNIIPTQVDKNAH